MKRFVLILLALLFLAGGQGNAQWERLPISGLHLLFSLKSYLLAVPLDSGLFYNIWRSSDDGFTWDTLHVDLPLIFDILQTDSGLYAATADGVYFSTDAGAHWSDRSAGIELGESGIREAHCILSVNGNLFIGSDSSRIYKTTDGGKKWVKRSITRPGSERNSIWELVSDGAALFARDEGQYHFYSTLRSKDEWITYEDITRKLPGDLYSVFRLFAIGRSLYAAAPRYGLYVSEDSGDSWRMILDEKKVGELFLPRGIGDKFISTWTRTVPPRLLFSAHGGSEWTDIKANLPDDMGDMTMNDRYFFMNDSRENGNWRRPLNQILAIHDEAMRIPDQFKIISLAPAPSFSQTTLTFALPRRAQILLTLHDLYGRTIRTVIDGGFEPGEHSIPVKTADLPPGVFIYRLSAVGAVKSGKMVVVR